MSIAETALLAFAAAVTAAMSAVAGLGGGIALLAILVAFFFTPADAVPVHAAIQLVSNSTRALAHRGHIDLRIVAAHGLLLVPAGVAGLAVATAIPTDAGRALIGVFALALVWRPHWFVPPARQVSSSAFVAIGALQGFLNIPLGATGPLIAPFFRAGTPHRLAFVATFAAAQTLGHIVKIALFSTADFAFGEHFWAIVAGASGAATGTLVGARVLGFLSETTFQSIFKVVITLLGLRLIATFVLQ